MTKKSLDSSKWIKDKDKDTVFYSLKSNGAKKFIKAYFNSEVKGSYKILELLDYNELPIEIRKMVKP